MLADGFTITRSIQSRKWPALSVNLEYAAVWGTCQQVSDEAGRIADEQPARRISSLLEPASRVFGMARRLAENNNIAFIGCYVLGSGFLLSPDEASALLVEDRANEAVLFPYLSGEDLNSRPDTSPSRWVIDFGDRSEAAASRYVEPFDRVVRLVKPERAKLKRKIRRERWWQFAELSKGLRAATARLSQVIVIAQVSRTLMPVRVDTGQVFSLMLCVFATDSFAFQATLSSGIHQCWVIKYGSQMRNDPRYTPSDVFETFPRPKPTDWLDKIGRRLDTERREIMLRRQLGLTKLYNMINDPDIADESDGDVAKLRAIHVELDRALMDAYGWIDVDLGHGFHTYRQMQRWTVSPAARVEILDRLLEENHRRAAAQGAAPTVVSDKEEREA